MGDTLITGTRSSPMPYGRQRKLLAWRLELSQPNLAGQLHGDSLHPRLNSDSAIHPSS
jgi:hypothetical protein